MLQYYPKGMLFVFKELEGFPRENVDPVKKLIACLDGRYLMLPWASNYYSLSQTGLSSDCDRLLTVAAHCATSAGLAPF